MSKGFDIPSNNYTIMTLQEKIDKLPKQIEYKGNIYTMRYGGNREYVFIEYYYLNPYKVIIRCGNQVYDQTPAQRLEDVVDRALTIIENKEWEK